jgi:hypothetical protein
MSWQDQLPPLDEERLYRRVIAAGATRREQRRKRRRDVVTVLGLVVGVAGLVGLFAALPDNEDGGDAAASDTTVSGAAETTSQGTATTISLPVGVVVAEPSAIWEAAPAGEVQCGPPVAEVRYRHDSPIASAELSWTVAAVTGAASMDVDDDTVMIALGPFATSTAPGSAASITIRVDGVGADGATFSATGSATLTSCPPR